MFQWLHENLYIVSAPEFFFFSFLMSENGQTCWVSFYHVNIESQSLNVFSPTHITSLCHHLFRKSDTKIQNKIYFDKKSEFSLLCMEMF